MNIFSKLKSYFSLNRDFLIKSHAVFGAANNAAGPKRFWLYAESLGEFRLAMRIIDAVKSVLSEKNAPSPVFFISFKTFSTAVLAKKNEGKGILFFFHPFFYFKPIFEKYLYAVNPDYFISIQHSISKKSLKWLLSAKSDIKIILAGINSSELRKMVASPSKIPVGHYYLTAIMSNNNNMQLDVMPISLKYMSCLEKNLGGKKTGISEEIVISFVSVHKKESEFIINMIKEIISENILPQGLNVKFILAPRNIKNSSKILKMLSKKAVDFKILQIECAKKGRLKELLHNPEIKAVIICEYGILDEVYLASDIVYVGKSLFKSEKGGHNVLEPALYGNAVITGAYASNFNDIIGEMLAINAIAVITENNFKDVLLGLIKDPNLRKETGKNALDFCIKKGNEFKNYFQDYIKEIVSL